MPGTAGMQVADRVQRTSTLSAVRTTAATSQQPQAVIYYSRPLEAVNPGQNKSVQAPPQSSLSAVGVNRGSTVSSFNKVVKHPMLRPPMTKVAATATVPMTSCGVPVTRAPVGSRQVGISSVTSPNKQSTDGSGPSVPGLAAVCTRGQRMEGAPVSFIRAILERSIASPEAYGSLCMVDDRSSVRPDHRTSTGGVGGDSGVASEAALQDGGSDVVHTASGRENVCDDVVVMSSSAGQSQPSKRPHPESVAGDQFGASSAKRVCLEQPDTTPIAAQQNFTMEMILAKYCKQQNTWPTSVGSSLSNGSGDDATLAVAGRDAGDMAKKTGDVKVPFATSSRITRSGMVALPKKIYAYLGSAMSHEHIANQLVPGSPSPPTNNGGASMDSSDGLVPASPTSSATSGRLSIESMTSSDDGPIRHLRLLCNGLRNAVQ